MIIPGSRDNIYLKIGKNLSHEVKWTNVQDDGEEDGEWGLRARVLLKGGVEIMGNKGGGGGKGKGRYGG